MARTARTFHQKSPKTRMSYMNRALDAQDSVFTELLHSHAISILPEFTQRLRRVSGSDTVTVTRYPVANETNPRTISGGDVVYNNRVVCVHDNGVRQFFRVTIQTYADNSNECEAIVAHATPTDETETSFSFTYN